MRLAFSVSINMDPDIMLVDEILAVGDQAFQKKCMAVFWRPAARAGLSLRLPCHRIGAGAFR